MSLWLLQSIHMTFACIHGCIHGHIKAHCRWYMDVTLHDTISFKNNFWIPLLSFVHFLQYSLSKTNPFFHFLQCVWHHDLTYCQRIQFPWSGGWHGCCSLLCSRHAESRSQDLQGATAWQQNSGWNWRCEMVIAIWMGDRGVGDRGGRRKGKHPFPFTWLLHTTEEEEYEASKVTHFLPGMPLDLLKDIRNRPGEAGTCFSFWPLLPGISVLCRALSHPAESMHSVQSGEG